MATPPSASDPNAVRDAARDILAQDEFQSHQRTWWEWVLHYATHPGDLVNDVSTWLYLQLVTSEFSVGTVVAWLIVAVFVTLVIVLVLRLTNSTGHDNVINVMYAPTGSDRSAAELLADAERFESEGKYREAIRARYSALLARLAEDGVVRRRAGRTTGEYLREVSANVPEASSDFATATTLFEWIWYGEGKPQAEDAAVFQRLADSVRKRAAA